MANYWGTPEVDEPTYEHYTGFGGKLTEARFDELLPTAIAKVDAAIWPNEVMPATLDAYRACICAVVDALDDPAVRRESIGATTLEYADVPTIASIIRDRLTGSDLLYRGI